MILLFLKSIIAGIIIAAPTGPTGVMCIRKGLMKRNYSSYITGLGASTADLLYAIIAGFGITIVSNFIIDKQHWFQLFGGLLLVALGIREVFLKGEPPFKYFEKGNNYWKDYFSGFIITIANPINILSFIAAYALIGVANFEHNAFASTLIVLGSVIGSVLCWGVLNYCVSKIRINIRGNIFGKINKISGTILILFGVFLLYNLFKLFQYT